MTTAPQSCQPSIDLVQDLRMDAEMLKDGHQKNLTKLWHSDAVKQAALNALKAAEVIEVYRADQAADEGLIASLKARLEQAERAVELLESNARVQAKLMADTGRRAVEQDAMLAEVADYLNSHSGMDGMDIGAKITAYRFAQQKASIGNGDVGNG